MEPINQSEKNLVALLRDTSSSNFTLSQTVELIIEFAYPDPTNNWNVNSACTTCPPPPARAEFVEYVYEEIKDLYCDHEDSAIPVAEYILSEIQKNSISGEVEQISHLNRLGAIVPAMEIWAMMVNTDRPWDHKDIIKTMFRGQGVIRPVKFEAVGDNSYSHYFKYKDNDYFLDVFSNIHYGYVGLKAGFSKETLLMGSNVQQFLYDINPFKGGDTKSDKESVEIGFRLYEETYGNPTALTSIDILESLEESSMGSNESRQPHWCWHPKNISPKLKAK